MPQINPSIPIIGQSDSTEDPKIVTALTQLVSAVNAVDSAQVSPTAGIVDTQLASPTNGVWRPILTATGFMSNVLSGTNYWFAVNGSFIASGGNASQPPPLWVPPAAADVAVAGKAARLRLRTILAVNGTAPGVNIVPAFYPITSFGGPAGSINLTLGAVLLNTTFVTPAAGSVTAMTSAIVDLSSLNPVTVFCFGLSGGASAPNSVVVAQMTLEMRHT